MKEYRSLSKDTVSHIYVTNQICSLSAGEMQGAPAKQDVNS
jgi:hypothetical protein